MYANIDGLVSWLKCEIGMCEAYANGAISIETRQCEERKKRIYSELLDKIEWLPKLEESKQAKEYEATQAIKKMSDEEQAKAAIAHFQYGISHDIFKEPVTTYAWLAVGALQKTLEPSQDVFEAMGFLGQVRDALDKIVIRSEQK